MNCEKRHLHCYGGLLGFCSHRIKLAQRAKAQWRAKERGEGQMLQMYQKYARLREVFVDFVGDPVSQGP